MSYTVARLGAARLAMVAVVATAGSWALVVGSPLLGLAVGDPVLARLGRLYLGGVFLVAGLCLAAGLALTGASDHLLRRLDRAGPIVLGGYAAFYTVSMVALGLLKTQALHTYADLGTHLEILWRARNGLGLTSLMSETYWGGSHWFAAHFTPIAYLLILPVFAAFPGVTSLVVLQTVALASAAVPVALYARDRLTPAAGPWAGLAFLLFPTLQYINLYEFEYLRFSIPFLAWAFYALHRRWTWCYAAAVGLALATREEVSLIVFAIGLYAVLAERRPRLGWATAAAGLGTFVLAVGVVIPSFREGGGLVYERWFMIPDAPAQWLLSMATDPVRIGNAAMLLLPFQFLPLVGWRILLVAVPNLASVFASGSMTHYAYFLYYVAPSVPFLAFSAIDGVDRLRSRLARPGTLLAERWEHVTRCIMLVVALGALGASVLFGPSPISLQFWLPDYRLGEFHSTDFHWSTYKVTPHARAARAVASLVPRDAVISAEQPFLPHLYDRRRMYVFPALGPDVEYVLIDRGHPMKTGWAETYLDFRRRPEHYYAMVEADSARWALVAETDGVRLYKRR